MIWPKFMCLTTDGIDQSHTDQVKALCSAGVEWVQLRAKEISDETLEPLAFECLIRCREIGARFILNDRLELALKIGADGVHLGKNDTPWIEAREQAGSEVIIGGTVNSLEDAKRAIASGALDYVGVGPFKYTQTKQNLAPILTQSDWRCILNALGDLPAYAIGGIEANDLSSVHSLGVKGAAVCSVLYRAPGVSENYHNLLKAYENGTTCHRR